LFLEASFNLEKALVDYLDTAVLVLAIDLAIPTLLAMVHFRVVFEFKLLKLL
jgi:hypothetical protein